MLDPNSEVPLWVLLDSAPPGEDTAEMYYNELLLVAQHLEQRFGKSPQADWLYEQAHVAKQHSDHFKANDYFPI